MTISRGLFVPRVGLVGTTTVEARRALAGMIEENDIGIPRSGLLTGADNLVTALSTMAYQVGAGVIAINRVNGEGVYLVALTNNTTVATTAAPGSNSRWDLIYVKQNDPEKADANNDAVLGVVQGTAASVPTKPTVSVPSGALVIAEARIYSGTAGTVTAPNTLTQVFPYTALRGAPVKVRSVTERNTITPTSGKTVLRMDQAYRTEISNGSSWNGPVSRYAEFTANDSNHPANTNWGPGYLTFDPVASNDGNFAEADTGSSDCFKILENGVYHIEYMAKGTGPVPSGSMAWITRKSEVGDAFTETAIGNGATWSYSIHGLLLVTSASTGSPWQLRIRCKTAQAWMQSWGRLRIVRL